uniref:Thioredoxin n=1 Tax=Acrobeloides nanus TaxID=290746 RepID=A0A914DDG4_9BILA
MPVLEANSQAEFDKLLANSKGKLVLVDFYATWCGPCKMMGPKFHKLADEFTNAVFIKVDIDENEDVASDYDIRVMPTFIFVKDGKTIDRFEGTNEEGLRNMIESHIQ